MLNHNRDVRLQNKEKTKKNKLVFLSVFSGSLEFSLPQTQHSVNAKFKDRKAEVNHEQELYCSY